jgi:pimeloyl-ACP methyl ester carboxylesterase
VAPIQLGFHLCVRGYPRNRHLDFAGTSFDRERFGTRAVVRILFNLVLLFVVLCPALQAKEVLPVCPSQRISFPAGSAGTNPSTLSKQLMPSKQLIVIGFMGGRVHAGNLTHREALVAKDLQRRYPLALYAETFANHDWAAALATVLQLLDTNRDGCLTVAEKSAARIVLYGHSWGASEAVTLARRLNKLSIPVLLTIQVDSVQKADEDDGLIPPNVREAVNFYQSEGLLHGRRSIAAMQPKQTTILGNFESSYKDKPVPCAGYPWFARTFMREHIEIENDPLVWNRIEALIASMVP